MRRRFLFDLSGGQSVGQLLGLRQIKVDIILLEKPCGNCVWGRGVTTYGEKDGDYGEEEGYLLLPRRGELLRFRRLRVRS